MDVYDFDIVAGDDLVIPMRYRDESGSPHDISGTTIKMDFKDPAFDRDAEITDALDGRFKVSFAEADTATVLGKAKQRCFDYKMLHIGDSITTLFKGRMTVKRVA